jgi:hypothetical protein
MKVADKIPAASMDSLLQCEISDNIAEISTRNGSARLPSAMRRSRTSLIRSATSTISEPSTEAEAACEGRGATGEGPAISLLRGIGVLEKEPSIFSGGITDRGGVTRPGGDLRHDTLGAVRA